jgi:hypothetical protein
MWTPHPIPVYRNATITDGAGCKAEVPGVSIAEEIEADEFAACERPEMDWSAIKPGEIHAFVFLHEVGHRVFNFSWIDFMMRGLGREDEKRWARALSRANELLADRFAWGQLYPGRPVPRSPAGAARAAEIDKEIAVLQTFLSFGSRNASPLPATPGAFVPCEYVDRGLMPGGAESS